MEFEVVNAGPVLPRVDQPSVLVALLVLLPLQVHEGAGRVLGLNPATTIAHHSANDALVVSLSQVVLL